MNTPVHHMYCNPIQPDGFRAPKFYFKSFFPFFSPNWRHIKNSSPSPSPSDRLHTARSAREVQYLPTAIAPAPHSRCSRVCPLFPCMGLQWVAAAPVYGSKSKVGCWTDGVREVWGIGIDHCVYML